MACIYKFKKNTKKSFTYDALVTHILENFKDKFEDMADLVYSVESPKDKIMRALQAIKQEGLTNSTVDISYSSGGDIVGKSSGSDLHVMTFIDDPRFATPEGERFNRQIDRNSFIIYRGGILANTLGISEEEGTKLADQEAKQWKLQSYDSFILNTLFKGSHSLDESEIDSILDQLIKERPELKNRAEAIRQNAALRRDIISARDKAHFMTRVSGNNSVLTNISLKTTIKVGGKDINLYDTIDQIVVDESGNVHVYKYKVSEDASQGWENGNYTSDKVEKYRYELAFIKAMLGEKLSNVGLDVSRVRLHLITLQTKYDHDKFKQDPNQDLELKGIDDTPNVVQMDVYDQKYQLTRHDNAVKQFIHPTTHVKVNSETFQEAQRIIDLTWIGKNIKVNVMNNNVNEWIKANYGKRLLPYHIGQYHYKLIYPGEREWIYIKDPAAPENNEEIKQTIQQFLDRDSEVNDNIVSIIQEAITYAKQHWHLTLSNVRGNALKGARNTIAEMIRPYVDHDDESESEWELIPNMDLAAANVIMFKHKVTGQIDILTLTNLNLDTQVDFKYGRSTLAGSYVEDIDSGGMLGATYGNVFAAKTAILINLIAPSFPPDTKLGQIKVISSAGHGMARSFDFQHFISKYFNPLMRIVQENQRDSNIVDNLSKFSCVDLYDCVLQELTTIFSSSRMLKDIPNKEELIEKLKEADSDEAKLQKLLDLAKMIDDAVHFTSRDRQDTVIAAIGGNDKLVNLVMLIGKTINQLKGIDVDAGVNISSFTRYWMPTNAIPSRNFQIVRYMWDSTSQKINDEAYTIGKEIDQLVQQYYRDKGYGSWQNGLVGNQASQFNNLYVRGDKNERLNIFKNPYDNNEYLQQFERTFLKKALFIFAKYRYMNQGLKFSFNMSDIDTPAYKEFIDKNQAWYFTTPLKKASDPTRRETGQNFKEAWSRLKMFVENPKLYALEYVDENMIKELAKEKNLDQEFRYLSLVNYFQHGEINIGSGDSRLRDELQNNHQDPDFFEHNVENLLRDFSFEAIRVQQMRKLVIGSKLFMLQMAFKAKQDNNNNDIKTELKYIEDFLKVNVFGMPLMESNTARIAGWVLPLRKVVSRLLIAGNISAGVRDVFEGFGQMMARAVTKFGTDITPGNVLEAYGIVTKEAMTNMSTANIVSQLCIKYRISNIDVSNVANGMKTGGRGLFAFDNEMYRTLRTPDFLNRMVMFVARCLKDGTWGAFSLDKNGYIVYDWKKDKRFSAFAVNDTTNPKYNEQKALFYSKIREYNQEHPDAPITSFDTLPMPYSNVEMNSFHRLSDDIWGSYDRSTKALGEHSIIGLTFGMFTTWMNGQYRMYFQAPQTYQDTGLKMVQYRDEHGRLAWWKEHEDGSVEIVYDEDTGTPVYVNAPIMVQGIWYTLKQMWNVIKDGGNIQKQVLNNDVNKGNLTKLLSDITITIIYMTLIRAMLDALRDKQKEETDPNDILTNGFCEVLYRGMYNAWDGFRGPLNVILYLGEQTDSPVYTESVKFTQDLFRTTFGDMTILSFGSRHFAPIRSVRETIKAYETGKQPS